MWKQNWSIVSTFFKYPEEIRKIIYTTNIVEVLHRQFRKVTKSKSIFPNDEALKIVISHFSVIFNDRLAQYL